MHKIYKFDDIVVNSTTKKKPEEIDRLHYIGLEHIDSGTFEISRWGSDIAPIGDKLVMKKGDVLFGKRRAYQRKVAVAPFDGIFSAHGMVLRPKEDVICKEYFPFFISSNQFMDTAVRISVGGLSPTVNWKDLQKQEFELPSISQQRVLADKLWAAYNLKEAYKKMNSAIDEMVKSQFIELISRSAEWKSLNEITTYIGKGITPKYVDHSNIAVINQACVYWTGLQPEHVKFHDVSVVLKKAYLEDLDILLNSTGRGTLGRSCLFVNPKDGRLYITDGHVSVIKVDRNIILPEVLVLISL